MEERRGTRPPTEPSEYLRNLPALLLLDRLPVGVLGVGVVGDARLRRRQHHDQDGTCPTYWSRIPNARDCLATLQAAESVVSWNHSDGHVVRTTVSTPLLMRNSDPLLLICLTDDLLDGCGPVALGRAVDLAEPPETGTL